MSTKVGAGSQVGAVDPATVEASPPTFEAPILPRSEDLRRLVGLIDEGVLERDRERRAPYEQFELVRAARLGALRIPRSRGGAGGTLRDLFETTIELAAADPNLTHALRNHFLFLESRLRLSNNGATDRWLDLAVDGQLFGQSSSELGSPQAGSPDASHDTWLAPNGDGYVLNGAKIYSTGNLYADWIVVAAQTSSGDSVRVVVPAHRDGVSLDDDWDGIGQQLTGSGTTRFDDVRVAFDELLVDSPSLFDGTPYQATFPQLYLTSVIAGILRRVTRDAVALVRGRRRTYYHAPTASPVDDPILQQTVGVIASNAYAVETMVLAAAEALDRATEAAVAGAPDHELSLQASLQAAKAKVVADDLGLRTATLLFDVGGATAVRQSQQLDRHWRNIRTLASHNPSTYKAKWIGGYEINGTPLPTGAFF
jgi:alkylation response protein AidB-like acyl-CoA dehydrogenase